MTTEANNPVKSLRSNGASPDQNDDKLARAKAALTDEPTLETWRQDADRLKVRLSEATQELLSDEQKRQLTEAARNQTERLAAQKKLAAREETRRQEEAVKRRDLADENRQRDAAAEEERRAKVAKIVSAEATIETIKNQPGSGLNSVRTMTSDAGAAIRDESLSAAKIAQGIKPPPTKSSGPIPGWLAGFGLVLILGGLLIGLGTIVQKRLWGRAPLESTRTGLIATDRQIVFDLTVDENQDWSRKLSALATATPTKEELLEIYFTRQIQETTEQGLIFEQVEAETEFLNDRLALGLPNDLLRFLGPRMLLGLHYGSNVAPFYLFTTAHYENAVAAWLADENRLAAGLLSRFGAQDGNNSEAEFGHHSFQDKLINNRDVRIVADENGNTVALVAWLDQNTLLITTNENTFEKIIERRLTK